VLVGVGESACRRGRGGGAFSRAPALGFERDHGGVVDEAVDEGGGDHGVAEDFAQASKPRFEVTMIEPRS
jgi:hypothetical protein